jgi:tetratricopeptide (TPR) repeat protein
VCWLAQHNLDEAKSLLEQAKKINSDQPYLWSTYGYYEYQRGELTGAIRDYRLELATFPERYGAYGDMAGAQLVLGQRKEAKETLQQWLAANPGDPTPTIRLVSIMLDDGDPAGAVAAAETGLAKLPEDKKKNEWLQLTLGRAQIAAGIPYSRSCSPPRIPAL